MTILSHHKIALIISQVCGILLVSVCAYAEMYGLNQVHLLKRFIVRL